MTSRIDGSGGYIYVPRAMYSLRMSFCIVPSSAAGSAPCFFATAMYMASRIDAVELMVIEVLTCSSGMPSNSVSMSTRLLMGTPARPTSPSDSR